MMIETVKGKLVAKKEGIYLLYVFEIEIDKYVMCTQLPNWDIPNITINEVGYLTYENAVAGEKYFNPKTEKYILYNYTNTYIKNFIKDIEQNNEEIIII